MEKIGNRWGEGSGVDNKSGKKYKETIRKRKKDRS